MNSAAQRGVDVDLDFFFLEMCVESEKKRKVYKFYDENSHHSSDEDEISFAGIYSHEKVQSFSSNDFVVLCDSEATLMSFHGWEISFNVV